MRALIHSLALLTTFAVVLALVACESEAPRALPIDAMIGPHHVRFEVPRGWLHIDHGREHIFERETARISLADFGPTTASGFAEIIRSARDLFRRNQWEDARTLLDGVDPRRFFASEQRWRSVKGDWKQITRIRRDQDAGQSGLISAEVEWDVEAAFAQLLAEIAALRDPDLESIANRALAELGHGELRGIERTEAIAVSGRSAFRIDTWDRLSHRGRRSYLFIENEGHLLVLTTEMGPATDLEAGFESLAASLSLVDDHGSEGAE